MHSISDLGSSHVSSGSNMISLRKEVTSFSRALARARVMGPLDSCCGDGRSMGMIVGCSASSPLPWERSDLGSKSSSPWYGERSLMLKMSLTEYLSRGMSILYALLL